MENSTSRCTVVTLSNEYRRRTRAAARARLGPYTIEALLGSGGMGEVYRARGNTLNRSVAIKVLVDVFPQLTRLYDLAARQLNLLPPSAAMAGVMTVIDNTRGVWNAPANIALNGVYGPAFGINDETQADLNKPLEGLAINVIRDFVGRGPIVWGARRLDGNSNDYRYVQMRRTLIYIEQSIKAAMNPFVFAPNHGKTWVSVVAMVSNFLQNLWPGAA